MDVELPPDIVVDLQRAVAIHCEYVPRELDHDDIVQVFVDLLTHRPGRSLGKAPPHVTPLGRDSLPPLPIELDGELADDRMITSTRQMAAVIICYGERSSSSSRYGHKDVFSSFRWRPSGQITFPTSYLEIRHDRVNPGGDSKNEENRRDIVEFDPDVFDLFTVQIFAAGHAGVLRELKGVEGGFDLAAMPCGVIELLVKNHEQVQRTYGSKERDFPAGSPQERFMEEVHSAKHFKIFVFLDRKEYRDAFASYQRMTMDLRRLCPGAVPRNDWMLARHEKYLTGARAPFNNLITSKTDFPIQPWLARYHAGQLIEIAEASNIGNQKPARASFSSAVQYIQHFIPALLMERGESARIFERQFSHDISYPAYIVATTDGRALVHVLLSNEDRFGGGSVVFPYSGQKCHIWIDGFSGVDHDMDYACVGRVSENTALHADFTIDVHVPWGVIIAGFEHDANNKRQIFITVESGAVDVAKKLRHLTTFDISGFQPNEHNRDIPLVDGKKSGFFELRGIIGEPDLHLYSPNFLEECSAALPADLDDIRKRVKRVLLIARANEEQTKFFWTALKGVRSNIITFEGLPGTGKTAITAGLIVALLILGKKVIATAKSNAGVQQLFDNVKELLEACCETAILHQIVRVYNTSVEESIRDSIRGKELPSGIVDSFSLDARLTDYIYDHLDDPVVEEYCGRLMGYGDKMKRPWSEQWLESEVKGFLQERVMEDVLFAAATCHVTSRLRDIGMQADVMCVDEAGEASEPDIVEAVITQTSLRLVVMVGDVRQSQPVVVSQIARRNAYGNPLSFSMMERLLVNYPTIESVCLTKCHRSHPSLIEIPSQVFYDGRLQPAQARGWSTSLSHRVKAVLADHDIFPQSHARPGDRQYFFDVKGKPTRGYTDSSWYNPNGCEAVLAMLKILTTRARAEEDEIGIISMYKDDRNKLLMAAREMGLHNVKIGTVDAFQGQEKKIMLVHFVAAMDNVRGPFGFTGQPNRLCVATTRAIEFQFLFGYLTFWREQLCEPFIARKNKSMSKLVDYVTHNGQVLHWGDVKVPGTAEVEGSEANEPAAEDW